MTASKLARILTISVVLSALGLGGTAHAQDGHTLSQPAGITQSDPSQPQPDGPTPQPPGTPQDPASPEDLAAPENPGTIPGSTTTTRPPVVRPKSLPVTVSPRAGRPGTTVTLHDPARVLALSDGVFAIIITLLVLEIHVPELTQGQSLNQALGEIRPSLVAFVISFVLTGMYWVGIGICSP